MTSLDIDQEEVLNKPNNSINQESFIVVQNVYTSCVSVILKTFTIFLVASLDREIIDGLPDMVRDLWRN